MIVNDLQNRSLIFYDRLMKLDNDQNMHENSIIFFDYCFRENQTENLHDQESLKLFPILLSDQVVESEGLCIILFAKWLRNSGSPGINFVFPGEIPQKKSNLFSCVFKRGSSSENPFPDDENRLVKSLGLYALGIIPRPHERKNN